MGFEIRVCVVAGVLAFGLGAGWGQMVPAGVAVGVAPAAGAAGAEKGGYLDTSLTAEARAKDLVGRLTLEEKATLLNHVFMGNVDGIISDKWNQCLHGVVWEKPTTMFPISIALAATWDVPLAHEEANAISDEARAIYNSWHTDAGFTGTKKGLIYRSPVINISRNPYWGRIAECFGEDPYLTGRIGVAYVKGLQGDDPKYLKLVSTLKHYAVNNVENGRQGLDAKVPERMLYEYWLPHFKDCIVEGGAQSIMASYNAINGTHNNMNKLLLTDILKDQWGFQGFVVSDLGGVASMMRSKQMTAQDAVALSIVAGCDFSDKEFADNIPAAVRAGSLPMARLDDAVYRVMRDRIRLGDLDPREMVPYSKIGMEVVCSAEHRALSLKVARESIVLLKNDGGLLPLDRTKIKTVAVIGPHAAIFTAGGYSGQAKDAVTPLMGMKNVAGAGVEVLYTQGGEIAPGRGGRGGPPIDRAAELKNAADLAKRADVAIVYVGTTTGVEAEGRDRTALGLPGNQEELVEAVMAANPRTVVVEMNAGPLAVPWIKEHVPAIVEAWWGGEQGGNAVAEVLFGEVNPAGRMPLTVYTGPEQVPPQDEYDVTKGFTYMYINGKPLFAFGHGLSYTTFGYDNLKLAAKEIADNGKVSVSVDVTNTGSRAGDEVVQLYVHQVKSSVKRPAKELRGFSRVSLAPGEKKTVTLDVPAEKLAFYDEGMHKFVVEPGVFEVMVGSSSEDIRVKGEVMVRKAGEP